MKHTPTIAAALGLVVLALAGWAGLAFAQTAGLQAGSVTMPVGQQSAVTVQTLDLLEPGLGAWTIDVRYDESAVSVVGCDSASGLCNPTYAEETVRFVGAVARGLLGKVVLGTLTVACVEEGTSALTVEASVFSDATSYTDGGPQPIELTIMDGTVTCSGEFGDVDCSGVVDAVDGLLILQFSAGILAALPCEPAGDVNLDGAVDTVDAALVLQLQAGLIDALPA